MRRRKRKMSPLSHLDRRQTNTKYPPPVRVTNLNQNCLHLIAVHLFSVILIHASILPNLVNLTTSQTTVNNGANLSTLLTATTSTSQSRYHHFDDDQYQLNKIGGQLNEVEQQHSRASIRAPIGANTTNVINADLKQTTNYKISSPQIVNNNNNNNRFDQEFQHQPTVNDGLHDDNRDQHIDDLLAVESNRSPGLLAHHLRNTNQLNQSSSRQSSPVAPYETSTKDDSQSSDRNDSRKLDFVSSNQSSSLGSSGDSNSVSGGSSRLLSIQTVPTLTPIYLKHPLPPALRPQLVAFSHPASSRVSNRSLSLDSATGTSGEQSSFALLPSWPNIYITQREHTLATTTSTTTTTSRPSIQQLDPKVPMNYPDWSRVDHQLSLARPRERMFSSRVEYDDDQQRAEPFPKRRSNLTTTSEIEQEDRGRNHDDLNETKSQQQRDRARQLLADSWTKLLNQAAKNNAMESLMLTNRSIVSLLCDTNNMLVKFKFKRPFYGMVETNLDPFRQCHLFGNGSQYYEMRIDLFECGTRQEMSRLFINNIQIKFQANNNHTRLFSSQRQQSIQNQDEFNQLETDETDEFKTLICSYPPPNSHSPAPTINIRDSESPSSSVSQQNFKPRPQSNLANSFDTTSLLAEKGNSGRPDEGGPSTGGLPERIVERPDDEAPARPVYYEPILLISGLLLLLLTIALALVSSAFIARRRQQQQSARMPNGTRGTIPTASNQSLAGNNSREGRTIDSLRIYGVSPAQLANRDTSPRPVAPPLIGVSKNNNRDPMRERQAAARPIQTSNSTARREQTQMTSPNLLKHKQRQMVKSGRERKITRKTSPAYMRQSSQTIHPTTNPPSDETTSTSANDKTSPSELSVTTIEIPYVSSKREQTQSDQQENKSSNLIRNVSSQTPSKQKDAKSQTVSPEPQLDEIVTEEIKRETSHEKIVERTSYVVLEPGYEQQNSNSAKNKQQTKENTTLKRQSPVPFGSFRSKLTSPVEFRRLENIVRLFDEDQPIASSTNLYGRYRTKIAKSLSPNERNQLRHMLKDDEAFRSNVVDSIDLETFNRKLRNNQRFSSRILSKATWDLLEEILLDENMNKPMPLIYNGMSKLITPTKSTPTSSSTQQPANLFDKPDHRHISSKTTTTTTEVPTKTWARERTVEIEMPDRDQMQPIVVTKSVQQDKSSSLLVERAKPSELKSTKILTNQQNRQVPTGDNTARQIQVSQSNSTRHIDGNTMINFDTVTNISSPRNFSAFTRSSFDLKQVTKFREDDSLPYMDD